MINSSDVFMDIKWETSSYYLSCVRIIQKRESQRDREHLVDLGDKLCNLGKGVLGIFDYEKKDCKHSLVNTYEGLGLAVAVEEEYVRNGRKEYAVRLREQGIASLRELGETLRKAQSPEEFDELAESIGALFKDWGAYAEEFVALWPTNQKHIWDLVTRAIVKKVECAT